MNTSVPAPANGSFIAGAALLAALAGVCLPPPAAAEAPFPTHVVSEHTLSMMRGGLEIAGLRLDLTAQLRTYIDHELALATDVRLERQAAGASKYAARIAAVQQRHMSRAQDSAAVPVQVNGSTDHANQQVVEVSVPAAEVAPVLAPLTGVTHVRHAVTQDQITSSVMNTADGRTVEQTLAVQVHVLNFKTFSEHARGALRAQQLGRMFAR